LLSFDDELAAPFVERIDEDDLRSSWHLIKPDGTRLKKGPAATALLEQLRCTRWLARWVGVLRLQWLVTAGNAFLYLIRKKVGRFTPDVPKVRRWP
jgi:predicted DCC family thiol-disulfide oxidoreductase YuxK